MRKISTTLMLLGSLMLTLNAQTIWPTADTLTQRASQFADAASIRVVKSDTALSANLANFKGWITMGIASDNAAKKDSAVWMWTDDGTGKTGAYWSGSAAVVTSDVSRGRGAAIFNSDFLDGRGTTVGGSGQAPADHKGELWSPIMDATGFSNMTLLFNQNYRHFTSGDSIPCVASTGISWSEDGGLTWSPIICIEENDGFGVNENARNRAMAVKLFGSRGTNKFRVKFIFDGNYYFWLLDDVRLGVPKYNVRVSPSWVALPPTTQQRNNVDSVRFLADVYNLGSAIAKNVRLRAQVFNNATKAEVFSTTLNYGDLKPDSLAENALMPQAFLPSSTAGVAYDIKYSLTHDSTDQFAADDSVRYNAILTVTDSLLQHDRDNATTFFNSGFAPASVNWTGTEVKAFKVGTYHYFPRGENSTATRISALVGDRTLITAARTYTASLYEWNDLNQNDTIEPRERNLVASGETIVAANPASSVVNFRLESALTNRPVYLKNNQAYLAMFEITPTTPSAIWYAGFDDRARFAYGAAQVATKKAGKPRYNGIMNRNGNNAAAVWYTDVFNNDDATTPKVRLYAWPIRINTKDDLADDYKVAIYPNPVDNQLTVGLDFPKVEEAVLLRIFDLNGKLLMEREALDVRSEKVGWNVSRLAAGAYLLQVQTVNERSRTLRFVKQ